MPDACSALVVWALSDQVLQDPRSFINNFEKMIEIYLLV